MPICSVGDNVCVIVLFATAHIPMTPNAVEFLCSVARAASGVDNTISFIPSPLSCTPSASIAKTDQFRGVWDISKRLNPTYSTTIGRFGVRVRVRVKVRVRDKVRFRLRVTFRI
jgi:hypothetical protein